MSPYKLQSTMAHCDRLFYLKLCLCSLQRTREGCRHTKKTVSSQVKSAQNLRFSQQCCWSILRCEAVLVGVHFKRQRSLHLLLHHKQSKFDYFTWRWHMGKSSCNEKLDLRLNQPAVNCYMPWRQTKWIKLGMFSIWEEHIQSDCTWFSLYTQSLRICVIHY